MATTFPPIVHKPFGRYFDHKSHIHSDLTEPYPTIENVSTTTLASAVSISPHHTSTSSILSITSAPLQPCNNENHGVYDVLPTAPGKRSISLPEPQINARNSLRHSAKPRGSHILSPRDNLDFSPTSLPRTSKFRDMEGPLIEDSRNSETGNTRVEPTNKEPLESGHELDKGGSKFSHWANTFRRKKCVPPRRPVLQSHCGPTLRIPGPDPPFGAHSFHFGQRERLSESSSGFVETLKTASFSNTNISFGPRSNRLTRSTETRGNRSSNVRHSIDSDCPVPRPSLDEGALCRGLRRRQILREILMSEESYLVDLRALSNLFSTLLTPAASLSTPAKTNIQRNLLEILHLHTELANELHRVSMIDTYPACMPDNLVRKSELRSHIKCSSFKTTTVVHERELRFRHSRQSIDSAESNAVLRTAEPSEAAAVARAFKRFVARFFIYEDYCSNHEVMLREVAASQRSISSWPLYETGIEALTRSIRAINHQRGGQKRAMTVGDLLMSPIQRLTKYPLLFADLHKSTPVIDCPDSYAEVDSTLQHLCELVREVNHVADDRVARERIRKRWLLQDRLAFNNETLQASQFRTLGHPILCGVLHLAYQTGTQVRGAYGLCILFETHMIMAVPARQAEKFEVIAVVHLSDLNTESTSDGKGKPT